LECFSGSPPRRWVPFSSWLTIHMLLNYSVLNERVSRWNLFWFVVLNCNT
jgi:hypothetical protein